MDFDDFFVITRILNYISSGDMISVYEDAYRRLDLCGVIHLSVLTCVQHVLQNVCSHEIAYTCVCALLCLCNGDMGGGVTWQIH